MSGFLLGLSFAFDSVECVQYLFFGSLSSKRRQPPLIPGFSFCHPAAVKFVFMSNATSSAFKHTPALFPFLCWLSSISVAT